MHFFVSYFVSYFYEKQCILRQNQYKNKKNQAPTKSPEVLDFTAFTAKSGFPKKTAFQLMTGIEPVTPSLPRKCSTSEPHQQTK